MGAIPTQALESLKLVSSIIERLKIYPMDSVGKVKSEKLVLILHNIRSRYNVGSIFRTADGAGIDRIYLCGITPAPPHSRISKVALGAENFIPWEKYKQTGRLLCKLKKRGYQVVALEQGKGSINYLKFKPKFPLALVLGAEVCGLSKSLIDKCDKIIEIPMHGNKESLNVSVACGISLFEIIKNK